MAKKEVKTDFWVYELLKDADINLTPQGCDIKDIDEALKRLLNQRLEMLAILNIVGSWKILLLLLRTRLTCPIILCLQKKTWLICQLSLLESMQ